MKSIDQLIPGVTPAKTKKPARGGADTVATQNLDKDHIDAINQVFAELELAYHNQFHKAYAQGGARALAMKYWLEVLGDFTPEVILAAVRDVVRKSEYLPSLALIVSTCENTFYLFGLPTVQAAYVEACCAPEPRSQHKWSHPAVYLAGQATGWFALASETQAQILPLFEYNYVQLCNRVVRGEVLDVPVQKALPETISAPLSPDENLQRMKDLRKKFQI